MSQVTLPMQVRRDGARLVPATIDREKRTVELVWTTGARVRRMSFWTDEQYDEELSLEDSHVDLSRLNEGAPFLDTHRQRELSAVIGVVERAWLEGKGPERKGRAVVRISEREDVEPIWRDISDGIIRNVSVGYQVRRFEVDRQAGEVPVYRAVDWLPTELSAVPVGADPGAGIREQGERHPCEIIERENPSMTKQPHAGAATGAAAARQDDAPAIAATEAAEQQRAASATPPADLAAVRREAVEQERQRAQQIRVRVRSVGLPEDVAEDLICRGVALEHAGDAIVDELAKRGGAVTMPRVEVGRSSEDPAEVRSAVAEALASRMTYGLAGGHQVDLTERARSYAGLTVLQSLAAYARAMGHRVSDNTPPAALYNQLVELRSLATSDFPLILADAGNKVLVQAYRLASPTYRLVFARKQFRDFKAHKFIRSGDFPVLLEKGESAEFKFGAMSEAKNDVTLATFGRIIGFSRQTLVNDDLGAFADLPVKVARRVADFENATAWALLALNSGGGPTIIEKNLPNGRPMYHADHGNLASPPAGISVGAVGLGRAAMMKQTSLDGLKLNIMPRYLVTSPDKFTEAEQFCSTGIVATKDTDTNPFKGRLTPVGDANLTGNGWYLFADPLDAETLVYGYLEGAEGPQLMTRDGFTTDGVDLRVHLDFAVGAIDYRGTYKNAGS